MKALDGHAATTTVDGLRFSPIEAVIDLTTAASVIALHLLPVTASPALPAIHAALFFVAFRTPTSAFLILSAVSYLPFKSLLPAEIGAAVAIPALFFWTRRLSSKDLGVTLYIALFFIFVATMTGRFEELQGNPLKVLFYAALGIVASHSYRGQFQKCLLGLSVGCLLVASPYWLDLAGLPVEINDAGSERAGLARAGGVRADAVLTWPPLVMGLGGVFGLALASLRRKRSSKLEESLSLISLGAAVWALPPLVATLCSSAIGAAMVLLCRLIHDTLRFRPVTMTDRSRMRRFRVTLGILTSGGILAVASDALELQTKLNALTVNYDTQSEELGIAASRTDVWQCAIESIALYPLTGAAFVGGTEPLPESYEDFGFYLAHNVFLDYGRYAGIPGLVFCAILFFLPIYRLRARASPDLHTPYTLFFVGALVFWMVLSYQFYKTVWLFWGLTWCAGSIKPLPSVRATRLTPTWLLPKSNAINDRSPIV